MRLTFAAIVLIGFPVVAAGQPALPDPRTDIRHSSIGLPLPTIGLPLPTIGLPLPPMGLRPMVTRPNIGDRQRSQAPEKPPHGRRKDLHLPPTVVFLVPAYAWGGFGLPSTPAPSVAVPNTSEREERDAYPVGKLILDVQPQRSVQVYIDGYYVGTPDDFNGALVLSAGPHRVELRAPGHQTVGFDVKIAAHRTITYRGVLNPEDAKPAPDFPRVGTTAPPTTLYVIPGCYLGNVPPEQAGLPVTCVGDPVVTTTSSPPAHP